MDKCSTWNESNVDIAQRCLHAHQNDLFIFFQMEESGPKEDARVPLAPARAKGNFELSSSQLCPFPAIS
jgi:hypothetical protein